MLIYHQVWVCYCIIKYNQLIIFFIVEVDNQRSTSADDSISSDTTGKKITFLYILTECIMHLVLIAHNLNPFALYKITAGAYILTIAIFVIVIISNK